MSNRIVLGKPTLVYSAPINEHTARWGVYCIPKLWKRTDDTFVIRINGVEDNGTLTQAAPNLYFSSADAGETWLFVPDGEVKYHDEQAFFNGINPLFTPLRNGDKVGIRKLPCPDIVGVPHLKAFPNACRSNILYVYPWRTLKETYARMEFVRFHGDTETAMPISVDFPEWELGVNAKAIENGVEQEIPQNAFGNDFITLFFTALTELPDGTFAALLHGQSPRIRDRVCEDVYFAISENGADWSIRATAVDGASMTETHSGALGDGAEMTLAVLSDGTLMIAMRNDCSFGRPHFCDCTVVTSADNGFHWSAPQSVADSSVTPHLLPVPKNGVLLITGRPGVHCRLSEDGGKTFGAPVSLIGKTLSEELADGKTYAEAKYFKTSSYSNTFAEPIAPNRYLVVYNDLHYDEGDGQKHKATFVRTVAVENR